jgi:Cu-Zn family superoxide dismutase
MRTWRWILSGVMSVAFTVGCANAADSKPETKKPTAMATIAGAGDNKGKISGKLAFKEVDGGVHVTGEVTGLTPGKHGFHIHEFGDLSSPDGTSLGGHFNPHGKAHGGPDAKERHAGDFGNIEADASGNAKASFLVKDLKLDGSDTILGRGVVLHAKADDLKTQPSGDAGGRVGVGAIGVAKP